MTYIGANQRQKKPDIERLCLRPIQHRSGQSSLFDCQLMASERLPISIQLGSMQGLALGLAQ